MRATRLACLTHQLVVSRASPLCVWRLAQALMILSVTVNLEGGLPPQWPRGFRQLTSLSIEGVPDALAARSPAQPPLTVCAEAGVGGCVRAGVGPVVPQAGHGSSRPVRTM